MNHPVQDPNLVYVLIPGPVYPRHKSWRKVVREVGPSRTGAFGLVGHFVSPGETVRLWIGSYMLFFDDAGDREHPMPEVFLARLTKAAWQVVEDAQGQIKASGSSWAKVILGRVADQFKAAPPPA